MKTIFKLLIFCLMITSCATKLNPNSNKAFFDGVNETIVWNQTRFEPSLFERTYKKDLMFTDDKETQDSFTEINSIAKKESFTFLSLWGAGVIYSIATDRESRSDTVYYGFLGAALIGGTYFYNQKKDKIKETIKNYNEKKNYVIFPSINSRNENQELGLNLFYSF